MSGDLQHAPKAPEASDRNYNNNARGSARMYPTRPAYASRSSIGIRRLPSSSALTTQTTAAAAAANALAFHDDEAYGEPSGRRRSTSEPQRMQQPQLLAIPQTTGTSLTQHSSNTMPSVAEESAAPREPGGTMVPVWEEMTADDGERMTPAPRPGMMRLASRSAMNALGLRQPTHVAGRNRASSAPAPPHLEYDSDVVDLLDVVDPEVATLSTLTNLQNSLFVPDLGGWLNRRPTYILSPRMQDIDSAKVDTMVAAERKMSPRDDPSLEPEILRSNTLNTITSRVNEGHFAVLPHSMSLVGWSEAEKLELDDHVRHMLHSRRAAFKRGWKGFRQYCKRPLGLFVTIYATLVTVFGLVWVLFLIGWISVGERKTYEVNVIDNVLVALFALVGDTLTPFRAVDTYHMIYIAHYHHLTWKLRKERNLPKLKNLNDLPSRPSMTLDREERADLEDEITKEEFSVLTPEQQRKLHHHQQKFSKSHTFYKPHETETHHAFPLRLLVAIVVLLDCHSLLQISLGTCTWAISYHVRPFALTTVILCCSITCNIMGGVLISVGDKRTRKKDVLERMFRQQLTAHAMEKIVKRRRAEQDRNSDLDRVVTPAGSDSGPGIPLNERPDDAEDFFVAIGGAMP